MNRADAVSALSLRIHSEKVESPMNSIGAQLAHGDFNMTLGYRHDSPVASPYAYTVKLAKRCRLTSSSLNISAINGKTLGAAWFVSNCYTESKREEYVEKLKGEKPISEKYIIDSAASPLSIICPEWAERRCDLGF
ncbi:hypothetical protein TELCIR_13367 [Teladorsagia circumcincta]|uniref:Uncharacterized protein n=1 Tax=Teladorsagia circumcincta TaxID=45464 RepID=A0A2G9U476_TELCI|nr:hypothetical protein TELCIR_13367 [Teladorsagia circumcincta]